METVMEKTSDSSRALLFGLLVECIFTPPEKESCPLGKLRTSLSFEKKYDYVMGLSKKEIARILVHHEKCYEKRCACFWQE